MHVKQRVDSAQSKERRTSWLEKTQVVELSVPLTSAKLESIFSLKSDRLKSHMSMSKEKVWPRPWAEAYLCFWSEATHASATALYISILLYTIESPSTACPSPVLMHRAGVHSLPVRTHVKGGSYSLNTCLHSL